MSFPDIITDLLITHTARSGAYADFVSHFSPRHFTIAVANGCDLRYAYFIMKNTLYYGDNLEIMRKYLAVANPSVKSTLFKQLSPNENSVFLTSSLKSNSTISWVCPATFFCKLDN